MIHHSTGIALAGIHKTGLISVSCMQKRGVDKQEIVDN